MPKLYDYFGLVVFFYSNEHEPVHVHGACGGGEAGADITVIDGRVARVVFSTVRGRPPLDRRRMSDFRKVVRRFADEIVARWIDYFVLNRRVKAQIINRKLK